MPVSLNCNQCKKEYSVIPAKKDTSKFCSRECQRKFHGHSNEPNTECTQCGKHYHVKPSQKKRYKRTNGYFCSNTCFAKFKKTNQYGSKNPNYKGRTLDQDGYRLYTFCADSQTSIRAKKLHRAVCCEVLGVNDIKGFHIHHRDCDVLNNVPENLVVLKVSDHKWLHKQFGNATLWAHYHNKVDTESLISWSDDKERAKRLLDLNVLDQKPDEIGVIKGDELLENPEVDNQQPSLEGDFLEGSTTRSRD